MKILFTIIICALFFSSCTSDNNRYVVLTTGEREGTYPSFLDTKTREIYIFSVEFGKITDLSKKSLEEAKQYP